MFAADPSVSIASIAAVAGVDRRTVYRQFASREELLEAIYEARLLAVSRGIEDARLSEAPVVVALHRYVENLVAVNRVWPVDVARMLANANEEVRQDWDSLAAEVDAFLQRAVDEGLLRSGLPEGWARVLLTELVQLVARQRPELNRGQAADVVVDTLLYGIGAPRERSGGLVG
ncbi:TetR/AcrR family transcriptional regulator [Catenulispora yoronensis]